MMQSQMQTPATDGPDLQAIERDLRRWSWATGGWAAVHAVGGILVVFSGAPMRVPGIALRIVVILLVAAWAGAAVASWQFRRSFNGRTAFVAAGASIAAGVLMGVIAVSFASLEGVADGVAHLVAGVGLARAVNQARPLLYLP